MNQTWTELAHTMETGRPAFDFKFGKPLFDYMTEQPAMAAAFAEGMTSTTRRAEDALVAAAPFGSFQLVIDVGGSFGSLVKLLLSQQPDAHGVVFDRPEIAEEAARRWADSSDDAGRLKAIGGDFFESVVEGGDLYLLKQILHDWQDEQCLVILRNIRNAMPTHGRVAIVEMVLPDDGSAHPGWVYDLMMMVTMGGRERTTGEYRELLEQAGFRIERVIPTGSALSVIEAKAAT